VIPKCERTHAPKSSTKNLKANRIIAPPTNDQQTASNESAMRFERDQTLRGGTSRETPPNSQHQPRTRQAANLRMPI
jgi:hypothetical protein